MNIGKSLLTAAALLGVFHSAWADVPLAVRDGVGSARKAEPVATGVCFKPGEVKDAGKLALFTKDGQPVPAQFLPIVTLEDGSVQWALLDFQADCPANGSAEYVVKIGQPPAPPKAPITAEDKAGVYTLSTGVLEVTVDATKPIFDLISSIKLDGKAIVGGAGPDAMTCRDALDGNKLYHAGKPTKAEFDWKGPARTTLMLEGPYVDDAGKEWLGYRVRISVFAGSKLVRIEHELRNSSPAEVRTVKVKDAFLRLAAPAAGANASSDKNFLADGDLFVKHRLISGYFSPGLHSLAIDNKKLVLGVVPTYEGGFEPRLHKGYNNQDKDKAGKPAEYNPGDTGSWWMVDDTYKVDEYWLAFDGGDEARAKGLDSRLYALAPAGYYSDCNAFGIGPFGTLEDEEATYVAWGWKNGEARKAALLKNEWMKARPEYHVASDLAHDETETDDAEGCLLMALRTGGRGYFDAGLAWARYYTNNFVWRTDYPVGTARKPGKAMKLVGKDDSDIVSWGMSYNNGRTCGCHFYGGGAMDYYVLTGEKSLLLGCGDVQEYTLKWDKSTPGKDGVGGYGTRGFGRQFLAAIRYYEITRDPAARKHMDHMAQLAVKEPNMIRDEDWAFICAPASNGMEKGLCTKTLNALPKLADYMKEKGLTWDEKASAITDKSGAKWNVYDAAGSWEQTYVQQAMERYYRLTHDKDVGDYVVRYANFFRKFAWNEHCQQVGYRLWGVHFPEKGTCLGSQSSKWDPKHDTCPGPGTKHDGWYTRFGPDVAVRAFTVSGDKKYLDQAKSYWNRGSKWGYQVTKPSAPDDEVATFATHVPPKDDSILSTALMFHFVPRTK